MALRYMLCGFGNRLRVNTGLTFRTIVSNNIEAVSQLTANHTSDDSKIGRKKQEIVKLLAKYYFDDTQTDKVLTRLDRHFSDDKLSVNAIRDTIDCWLSSINPKRLRPNQLDKFRAEDIDYDLAVDFQTIISDVEPELLLMSSDAITERVDNLRNLDIIGGHRCLWRAFVYAPRAYYMQHWHDFMKKYYYLQFKVLEWLVDKKDKDKLHPHPMIRNAKVMELSFDTIRCRYLFAQRTGLKSASITTELFDGKFAQQIDLRMLMLSPIDQYLHDVAPKCTEEEYLVFKKMLSEREIDNEEAEEEKLIDELIELNALKYIPYPKVTDEVEDPTQYITIKEPRDPNLDTFKN